MSIPFYHKCEYPGCDMSLTFGIFKFSITRFKKAYCMAHQQIMGSKISGAKKKWWEKLTT